MKITEYNDLVDSLDLMNAYQNPGYPIDRNSSCDKSETLRLLMTLYCLEMNQWVLLQRRDMNASDLSLESLNYL